MPTYTPPQVSWEVEPDHDVSPLVNYLTPVVPLPTNPLTGRRPTWYYMHRPVNNAYTPIVEDGTFNIAPWSNYAQVPRGGYQLGYNQITTPDVYTGYLDDWAFPNANQQ